MANDDKELLAKQNYAAAPYNFIPLNKKVLKPALSAETEKQLSDVQVEGYTKALLERKLYDGYFKVSINNETPLFIGMYAKASQAFAVDGKYYIPGSSLRGCLKNIFKIITNSAFRVKKDTVASKSNIENADVEAETFYYRVPAGPKTNPNSSRYKEKINITRDRKSEKIVFHSVKAGYLVREEGTLYIYPASLSAKKYEEGEPSDKDPLKETRPRPMVEWYDDCCVVYSGAMDKKSHCYIVGKPITNGARLIISEALENLYKKDVLRNGVNLINSSLNEKTKKSEYENIQNGLAKTPEHKLPLLAGLNKAEYIIPCFYIEKGHNIVEYFGSSPNFRIPYTTPFEKHVPGELNQQAPDFTDMVFGNGKLWSSRISVENFALIEGQAGKKQAKEYSKVLLGAKASSFQLYLEHEEKSGEHLPKSWENKDALLRGYKLYWHSNKDWRLSKAEKDKIKSEEVLREMEPMDKGHTFEGKIHFKDLDINELGALCQLFTITEAKGCCLKLGAGGPIGLGSVKLKAELFLEDEDYLSTLFDEKGFAEAKTVDKQQYAEVFLQYVKDQLGDSFKEDYLERIEKLKKMLSTEHIAASNWNELTRYMDIEGKSKSGDSLGDGDRYNYKCPLPDIDTVIEHIKH